MTEEMNWRLMELVLGNVEIDIDRKRILLQPRQARENWGGYWSLRLVGGDVTSLTRVSIYFMYRRYVANQMVN
jgi:hypothetical protein